MTNIIINNDIKLWPKVQNPRKATNKTYEIKIIIITINNTE